MFFNIEDILKILLACVLGGIIGQQRHKKGMAMGLRTHIVTCVSATLVQIISIDYNLLNNANIDAMRLGAQVISGIGFLGMASIIKDGRNVIGLTTSASIWFIACVGLAVGSGIYIPAIISTLVIYIILTDVFKLETRMDKKKNISKTYQLEVKVKGSKNDKDEIDEIYSIVKGFEAEISDTNICTEGNEYIVLILAITIPFNKQTFDLATKLLHCYSVEKVSIT